VIANKSLYTVRSSETIRTVTCWSHADLGITEDEWVLLVKTLGSIKGINNLELFCAHGSRDFHPFQAIADAVNNAPSLCELEFRMHDESFPRDPSGMIALANALREHTALQDLAWYDFADRQEVAPRDLSPDLVLEALSACPHLRKVVIKIPLASAGAMKTLLQLRPATKLHLLLETDQWLAVADEIRQGRCNVQSLILVMYRGATSDATQAVKALASAIQLDCNLECLDLRMENGFTDEAGVTLAEALTVNTTLRLLRLDDFVFASLGCPVYEAFSAMLRVNTSLRVELPSFDDAFDGVGVDERIVDSRNQMRIEQELNHVGRGRLLSSSQTPREEWVDALHDLNSSNVDETPEFNVSCLFRLLRLNPSVCMS
jgi:hypothetical protein